ncbi:hypothetical protein PAMA_016337 [Pampus argenteus]
MKLKFGQETLPPPQTESSDKSPEVDEIYECEYLPPDYQYPAEDSNTLRVSMSSIIPLAEDTNQTIVAITVPAQFETSIQAKPEEVSVTPDLTTSSSLQSVPPSLGSGKDRLVSPTESFSIPQSSQSDCEVMELSLSSSFPSDVVQASKDCENATETFCSMSFPKVSGKTLINLGQEEDYTSNIIQSQKEHESTTSSNDLRGVTDESSIQSIQDLSTHLWEATSVEAIRTDDFSSQSPSDLTPETVTSARHFSFDELMPHPSSGNLDTSSDEDRPWTSAQQSEESLTPVDYEDFASQLTSVKNNAEIASSTSDEEYSIPAETSSTTTNNTHMPPEYEEVVRNGANSPTFEYSDPEPYFDCKQGASDLSETEPDELETRSGCQPQDHLSHAGEQENVNRRVLLSSGSEDYEDAFFVHERLHNIHEESEELLHNSEESGDEFTLCEPPVCEVGAYVDTNTTLTREITKELGSMSESSDDEFLTTRIVRRRIVIQADEIANLPTQSVTEEKYTDENGHIVVKKVTRKIIRKCISVDGAECKDVSLDGAPQGSINIAEGDGYSKVVKRTVVKSEGDNTEVTFTECEGFSASRQETTEGCKVSQEERTTVVEGERTMTHQGDPSLASDLPSAQEDFKQALGYISGFTRSALPHVVEKETVKEDGTVVVRAHMRKGHTHKRTVVRGAGQRERVLLEQVDSPRKGSKRRDLQQHLHQLFHHYCKEENEDNEEKEKE